MSDTSVSDAIANGACTRCKGDAYLFYDAAGGHCWKCDVAELTAALLAARREVRALETALVDHAASGAEIERAVKTFRSLENQRSDFAAMVEVLDEYERNRRTREARPNATRPFPWRAVINGPDDAQVVCGEHGNPSTFAQIAECHTAADAEFIVEACNAALAARRENDELRGSLKAVLEAQHGGVAPI